jgi:hypothetical protein
MIEWQQEGRGILLRGDLRLPSFERDSADAFLTSSGHEDLTALNTCRLILDAVGTSLLPEIAGNFLDLPDTSAAVYEKNGDYAYAGFSSAWCLFLDLTSRRRRGSPGEREALASGSWHCHESHWNDAGRRSI